MGFWEWFIGEPGGVWIIGVVAVLWAVYERWQNVRPNRLVVLETGRSSLLRVHPDLRDEIAAAYKGVPVDALSQIEVVVSNDGNETILRPTLTVVTPGARLLAVHVQGEFGDAYAKVVLDEDLARVELPYVNSRQHDHRVVLRLVADGDVGRVQYSGGGEGWSVKVVQPRNSHRGMPATAYPAVSAGVVVLLTLLAGGPPFYGEMNLIEVTLLGLLVGVLVGVGLLLLEVLAGRVRKWRGDGGTT